MNGTANVVKTNSLQNSQIRLLFKPTKNIIKTSRKDDWVLVFFGGAKM